MSSGLPQGWSTMEVGAAHSDSLTTIDVGWTWTGMRDVTFGQSSGTGLFGFIIRQIPSDNQSFGYSVDNGMSASIIFHIEVTNPEVISTQGLKRLQLELGALPYTTNSPIPAPGTYWGHSSESNPYTQYPIVWAISFRQRDKNITNMWVADVTIKLDQITQGSSPNPDPDSTSKETVEESPWELGVDSSVALGVEDFTLGLGKFIGSETPSDMSTALQDDTYASKFNKPSGGELQVVMNSAGDPLENPPPMKIGTASITLSRSFQTLPPGLALAMQEAREQVCTEAITVNDITFPAYTCKMTGANIVKKRHKKNADWLPKQIHPFGKTWAELGWKAKDGESNNVAINTTKNVMPAFEYEDYFDVSVTIQQRKLGWGYALVDKGYRKLVNGKKKEIRDVASRQTYSSILEDGSEVDMSGGASNKRVLRLYQVLDVGDKLETVMDILMAEPNGGGDNP